ncbi:MAG: glycosyltransferase family 4 protein [Anaerolineae bacterium]
MKLAVNGWFCNQIQTGSGQYLRHLLPALTGLNPDLEITLVAPDHALSGSAVHWPEQVRMWPVRVRPGRPGKVWFEQRLFPRAARAAGADVAHVPYFGSALAPQLPTVVTVHDLIPMVLPRYRGGPLVRLYTSLVAAAAANANLILADSDASRRDILAHLKLPPNRVRTVHLAPAPHYAPAESRPPVEAVIKKYNLPPDFALYIGGYDARKNVPALLHAWTYVVAGLGDELKLVLAGQLPAADTPFFPDPLKIARRLGVEDFVVTPGPIDEADKPLLYSAARLFVYPSRYEGFGLPVLEAMACGTPVVTTTAASLPELAGAEAFMVDPDDTRRMASPIISLAIQDDTHTEMANRGYRQAQKFNWQITARKTLQAYRDVVR